MLRNSAYVVSLIKLPECVDKQRIHELHRSFDSLSPFSAFLAFDYYQGKAQERVETNSAGFYARAKIVQSVNNCQTCNIQACQACCGQRGSSRIIGFILIRTCFCLAPNAHVHSLFSQRISFPDLISLAGAATHHHEL